MELRAVVVAPTGELEEIAARLWGMFVIQLHLAGDAQRRSETKTVSFLDTPQQSKLKIWQAFLQETSGYT